MKTIALIAGTTAALLAGTALADDDHGRRVAPSAPQPIADILRDGGGTVAGSVTAAGATWLTVSDGSEEIDVASRGFLPEGIRPGDPITVTGGLRRGALSADHIILADGTAYGRDSSRRERRDHDEDDD